MKEIIIALISGLSGGALITWAITVNHYSKKLYNKNVLQRIVSLVNFGNVVYNDEKKINEIVDDKTKHKPDILVSESEPKEGQQKPGDYWEQPY